MGRSSLSLPLTYTEFSPPPPLPPPHPPTHLVLTQLSRRYAYANESLHPTAWVGQQAVDFITNRSAFIANVSLKEAPWFLKVSFHRPHSPYDPPQRLIDATPLSALRPVYTCAKDDPLAWDSDFGVNGQSCGPAKLDAWCGDMPANDSAFSRRCYQVSRPLSPLSPP